MTTKKKRIAQQRAQQPTSGLITPPEIVDGLVVRRTIGEDEVFGHCSHALQLLPNGVILLLVTSEGGDGIETDTFVLGEEVVGYKALKTPVEPVESDEAPDDPA